jgi:hypothetical protein
MNIHLKYLNGQNILKDLGQRTIVAVTNIVRTYVLETAYVCNGG